MAAPMTSLLPTCATVQMIPPSGAEARICATSSASSGSMSLATSSVGMNGTRMSSTR